VKKVSTRPAGQQPFTFGKSSSQLSIKPAGTQAVFTFGNRNQPDTRFGIGQAMLAATPPVSKQAPRDPRRSHGTLGAPTGTSKARHISGLSPLSATTSAVAPQGPVPTSAPHQGQEGELRTSSSIALQRMGPSALERMAAEQEKKCREENKKKDQLEKMLALKRANASGQGLVHQGDLAVEAQKLERERRELELERRRLEEEKTLVATQKKVVELQEELLKLKQEKSGIPETGQSNIKPMRDRVGKRDVWERVGGSEQVLRRKDMSVKERVGEARKQQALQMRSDDGEHPQLAYCSDRFRQGLEESLDRQGENKSQSRGRNYNQSQERGYNMRKNKSRPIPEELVLTELTDAGPVKKENFVGRAQAAKFSDESSEEEEEEEEEEYGQPKKSMKRHW